MAAGKLPGTLCWLSATRGRVSLRAANRACAQKWRGRPRQSALPSAALSSGEARAMRLSQMWREHLQAGCPAEMRGLNIAGTAARELDAEITACVSACVSHSLKMDSRIERRLHDIAHALETVEPASPEVAAYCSRLNKLV